MSTSSLSGFVDQATYVGRAETPLDTQLVRELGNNVNHLQDSLGQVRVNWPGVPANIGLAPYLTAPGGGFGQIAVFGPFPVFLRQDGSAYRLRVRLAGAAGSGSVSFKIILAPFREARRYARGGSAVDWVWESVTISSATPAWLSGSSNGDLADPVLCTIPAREIARWVETVSTVDPNGVAVSVNEARIHATVTGIGDARLYGLHVSEYHGDSA